MTAARIRTLRGRKREYLFDASGEQPADSSYPRSVLRWLLDVAARRGVGHRATRLLCVLEAHAADGGRCFPSVATLARLLGHATPNSTHVYTDLAELEAAGLVEKRREGKRVVRYVLRPGGYVRSGRTDTSETDARHVRSGRVGTSEVDAGRTQPKTHRKEQPKTQAGRGASSPSEGSGRVQKGRRPVEASESRAPDERPTRTAVLRGRVERLGDGAARGREGEIVEEARRLGFRAVGLVRRVLHDRGRGWMRDLLAAAANADNPGAFMGKFLKKPDEFDRPAGDEDDSGLDLEDECGEHLGRGEDREDRERGSRVVALEDGYARDYPDGSRMPCDQYGEPIEETEASGRDEEGAGSREYDAEDEDDEEGEEEDDEGEDGE